MPTPLELATAALDAAAVDHVGDTILYRRAGSPSFTELRGFFDGGSALDESAGSIRISIDRPTLHVRVSDLAEPKAADRIVVSGKPDVYKPRNWTLDESGSFWILPLEKAF